MRVFGFVHIQLINRLIYMMDYIIALMTFEPSLYICDESEFIITVFKMYSCIWFAIILLSISVFTFTTEMIF